MEAALSKPSEPSPAPRPQGGEAAGTPLSVRLPHSPAVQAARSHHLHLSELRYRRLFEAARDGILIVDPLTRRIVDVNPFLVRFLGYAHAEFLGKELFEIGLLKDEPASRAAFRELQSAGYIRYDDLPLETKDGRRVDVEFVSNLYREGDHQVIQCNIRDITARKRSDLALRESERRFKLVARAVSDVAWDRDLATGVHWWSDGLAPLLGYATEEIGSDFGAWTRHIHPEDLGRVVDGFHGAVRGDAETWRDEYRIQCKDGSTVVVLDRGCILRDPTGKAVRVVGGLQDLTEARRLESQYLRAQRMESIGTLAGGIAHDLNNVLTPIMMSIELLEPAPGCDPERSALLDSIRISCHRGAALVRQVLSFARGLEGRHVPVDPRQLIAELQALLAGTFPHNIEMVVQVADGVWEIGGDPSQLQQVLLNLAVNARDAMPRGGTLTIAVANIVLDPQYAGTSHTARSGNHVAIRVSDTGHGISPEIRERIFDPFFTTKEPGRGTGLGLATVHAILKNHAGSITVESRLGLGTTFTICLPAAAAPAVARSPVVAAADYPRGRGELVLVVDDEPAIRHITRRTLEANGYRVLTAEDGAEAVALYARQGESIAIVLTDMMMPVMDGPAAIHALRRLDPAVRIIAVSGRESAEHAAGAGAAAACDFLPKPYTARALCTRIREVLDRPAAPRPDGVS